MTHSFPFPHGADVNINPGWSDFRLLSPLDWYCVRMKLGPKLTECYGTVPAGDESDGASTPATARAIYPTTGHRYSFPAFVHDDLYFGGMIRDAKDWRRPTRAEADAVLWHLMRANHCALLTCWIFWIAVRLFGGRHWRKA